MEDCFTGMLMRFAGNFAMDGWDFCNGQSLDIKNNEALFSIIGTTYGGDGVHNFNLPNLNSGLSAQDPKWLICKRGIYPTRP